MWRASILQSCTYPRGLGASCCRHLDRLCVYHIDCCTCSHAGPARSLFINRHDCLCIWTTGCGLGVHVLECVGSVRTQAYTALKKILKSLVAYVGDGGRGREMKKLSGSDWKRNSFLWRALRSRLRVLNS